MIIEACRSLFLKIPSIVAFKLLLLYVSSSRTIDTIDVLKRSWFLNMEWAACACVTSVSCGVQAYTAQLTFLVVSVCKSDPQYDCVIKKQLRSYTCLTERHTVQRLWGSFKSLIERL